MAPHSDWKRSQFVLNHEGFQQVIFVFLFCILKVGVCLFYSQVKFSSNLILLCYCDDNTPCLILYKVFLVAFNSGRIIKSGRLKIENDQGSNMLSILMVYLLI